MTDRTKAGLATTDLILEIFRANGALLTAGNNIAKTYGLTSARWQIMGAIDLEGRPLTVSQIARRMGLARQGVQRIVNELQSQDLLIANDNIDHKKAKLFMLTSHGQQILNKIDEAQTQWVNQLSQDFDAAQIPQAISVLETMCRALRA